MKFPVRSSIAILFSMTLLLLSGGNGVRGGELPEIFNGEDLTGWKVPEDNQWWKVKEGVLRGENNPARKGSNLWTEKEYKNFVMQLEFKMVEGDVDSGIFVRAESQQIQIGRSGSLKRDMTGSPYIIGNGYPKEAEGVKELLKTDQWNSMMVVAMGRYYSVWLNGSHVLTYRSKTAVEKGPIGLQVHPGNRMTIDFRNIRLAELQ